MGKLKIAEEKGDLFDVDKKYVLAHNIFCHTKHAPIDAGIAAQFRARYPEMMAYLEEDNLVVGKAIRFVNGDGRVVYNLTPKVHFYDRWSPCYELFLEKALSSLAKQMTGNGEKYLAMPRIACGLDKGDWRTVWRMVISAFRGQDVEVLAMYL